MLETCLIQHCAPTLAGVKSANLFTCPVQDEKALKYMIDHHNRLLNPKGVHIALLRVRKGAARGNKSVFGALWLRQSDGRTSDACLSDKPLAGK